MVVDEPRNRVIFYADDDKEDGEFFAYAIHDIDPGAFVSIYENGLGLYRALESIDSGQLPSCIVLDLNMPVWNGFKTLSEIRKLRKFDAVPIYMLTTSQSISEKKESEFLGANGFYTKPHSSVELRAVCAELIKNCPGAPPGDLPREGGDTSNID